jgi:hypothetical protein
MLVKLYEDVNNPIEFEINSTSIKEILNHIKNQIDESITESILFEKHLFLGKVGDEFKPIDEDGVINALALYPEIIIIKTHEGEDPITATIALAASYAGGMVATGVGMASAALGLGSLSAGLATGIITTVATIVEVGITMGVSMAVSAIMSPDSTFSGDPSQSQKGSKLFNQSLITREQGGSVPLCYGNPFCGGVAVSSGITSKERTDSATSTIQTPTNVSPVNGATGQSTSPTLTASAFAMDPGETGTHLSSDWVLADTIGFGNLIKTSYRDTTHKTSITFSGLKSGKTYFWKVRYRTDDNNVSAWSTPYSFTTA